MSAHEVWVRDCACECFLCSEGIGHCDERPDCQEVFTRDGLVPYDGPTGAGVNDD